MKKRMQLLVVVMGLSIVTSVWCPAEGGDFTGGDVDTTLNKPSHDDTGDDGFGRHLGEKPGDGGQRVNRGYESGTGLPTSAKPSGYSDSSSLKNNAAMDQLQQSPTGSTDSSFQATVKVTDDLPGAQPIEIDNTTGDQSSAQTLLTQGEIIKRQDLLNQVDQNISSLKAEMDPAIKDKIDILLREKNISRADISLKDDISKCQELAELLERLKKRAEDNQLSLSEYDEMLKDVQGKYVEALTKLADHIKANDLLEQTQERVAQYLEENGIRPMTFERLAPYAFAEYMIRVNGMDRYVAQYMKGSYGTGDVAQETLVNRLTNMELQIKSIVEEVKPVFDLNNAQKEIAQYLKDKGVNGDFLQSQSGDVQIYNELMEKMNKYLTRFKEGEFNNATFQKKLDLIIPQIKVVVDLIATRKQSVANEDIKNAEQYITQFLIVRGIDVDFLHQKLTDQGGVYDKTLKDLQTYQKDYLNGKIDYVTFTKKVTSATESLEQSITDALTTKNAKKLIKEWNISKVKANKKGRKQRVAFSKKSKKDIQQEISNYMTKQGVKLKDFSSDELKQYNILMADLTKLRSDYVDSTVKDLQFNLETTGMVNSIKDLIATIGKNKIEAKNRVSRVQQQSLPVRSNNGSSTTKPRNVIARSKVVEMAKDSLAEQEKNFYTTRNGINASYKDLVTFLKGKMSLKDLQDEYRFDAPNLEELSNRYQKNLQDFEDLISKYQSGKLTSAIFNKSVLILKVRLDAIRQFAAE